MCVCVCAAGRGGGRGGVQEVELEELAVEAGHPAGRVAHGSRRAAEGGGGRG